MADKQLILVIQSFGRENEYKRAILTILSFYTHISLPIEQTGVLLFTDKPAYFSVYLKGLPVEYVVLTPEKIKHMRGEIDFLHRMKIALIEESFLRSTGNLLYADSDSFFIGDPFVFSQKVNEGVSFMHVHEYQFGSIRNLQLPAGKTFQDFLQLVEFKTFTLANGQELSVTPEHSSWNAGIMFFHSSHKSLLPDVYALTEQFYSPTRNHASEQYAFSVILQERTKLCSCEKVSYHYWYRVKKQIADEFLDKKITKEWANIGLVKKLEVVRQWIAELSLLFEHHVFSLKDNSIQELNNNKFKKGYYWAVRAMGKGAIKDVAFVKDVLYHFKRQIGGK